MRKFILAALLALPLTALAQSQASAGGDCCCCCSPTLTCNFGFKLKTWGCIGLCCDNCAPCCSPCGGCGSGCGGGCCAPWYSYWPYDAHFQTPAPTGYPGWPSAQGAMMYGSPACASNYGYGPPPPAMAYQSPPQMMYGNPACASNYGYGPPAPAMAMPSPAPMQYSAPTVQPCGYTPAQAPSYWYGR